QIGKSRPARLITGNRKEAPLVRQEVLRRQNIGEHSDAHADDAEKHADAINPAAAIEGDEQADEQRQDVTGEKGGYRQLQRWTGALDDHRPDAFMRRLRATEIEGGDFVQVAEILAMQRQIEALLFFAAVELFLGDVLAEHLIARVAADGVEKDE